MKFLSRKKTDFAVMVWKIITKQNKRVKSNYVIRSTVLKKKNYWKLELS